jgi:hypothetical protein
MGNCVEALTDLSVDKMGLISGSRTRDLNQFRSSFEPIRCVHLSAYQASNLNQPGSLYPWSICASHIFREIITGHGLLNKQAA